MPGEYSQPTPGPPSWGETEFRAEQEALKGFVGPPLPVPEANEDVDALARQKLLDGKEPSRADREAVVESFTYDVARHAHDRAAATRMNELPPGHITARQQTSWQSRQKEAQRGADEQAAEAERRRREELDIAEGILHKSATLARTLVKHDLGFDPGLEGWRIGYGVSREDAEDGTPNRTEEGLLLQPKGTLAAFTRTWRERPVSDDDPRPHTNLTSETTGTGWNHAEQLVDDYEEDLPGLADDIDSLAESYGLDPAKLNRQTIIDLAAYREDTAEIFADRRANGRFERTGGRATKLYSRKAKIGALVALGLALGGGAFVAAENRPVSISGQEYARAEDDFTEGRAAQDASGQIEAKISDGGSVGFILEQCPVTVMEKYDKERGVRKAGCKLVAVRVADGAWLNYKEGDLYP